MERARRLRIQQLGPELTCHLCNGYFVDAFTVVECLHSFCKSCIMEHVKKSCDCPTCGTQLNKARLTSALRPDQTLQSVVYKLVPRLFNDEMQRRRDFYQHHPNRDRSLSPERRGDVSSQQFVYTLTDPVSFSLEFCRSSTENDEKADLPAVRYFQAPAGLGVSHLKKLLHLKHGLQSHDAKIEILYAGDILPDELIIMDVAYMYNWDRSAPMRFTYRYTTKRPLGVEVPGSTAPSSKRRCRELAAESKSGADSDKENIENDARPILTTATVTAAAAATAAATAVEAPPTAAAVKPAVQPARRPAAAAAVGAVPEAAREPMTSPVTSLRAEPGTATASPASTSTESNPAACAVSEASGVATSEHRQTAGSSAGGTDVGNGDRATQTVGNVDNRSVASGENSAMANGGNSAVANGDRNGMSNGQRNGVSNGERNGEKSDGNSMESVEKNSVCANREEVSSVTNQVKSSVVAEKTMATKQPAVLSNGEKHPRSTSAKDAVMVASGEMKRVDRQGAKRPPGPPQSAPQPIRPKTDVPKSSTTPNGVHIGPKPFCSVQSRSTITHIVPKPPPSSNNGDLTSKLSHSGVMLKHSAASKPSLSPRARPLSPKAAGSDSSKGSAAQSQGVSKLATAQSITSSKTVPSQTTGGVASLSTSTNPSTQNPPTPSTSSAPGPAPSQNSSVSKQPNAPPNTPVPTSGPVQKDGDVPPRSGPASIVAPAASQPERASGGGADRTPAADDRHCEDSGVDTDSSERPGTDSARSPIDVYDFDAEAEDETAVRLKVPHVPEARSAVRPPTMARMAWAAGAPRPKGASTTDIRHASPGVRMDAPARRPMHSRAPAAPHVERPAPRSVQACSIQRPIHPSTPAGTSQRLTPSSTPAGPSQRPAPPSTPGAPFVQRLVPASTPAMPPQRPAHSGSQSVPSQRPVPSGTPAVSVQRPTIPSTPGVFPIHHQATGPGASPAQYPAGSGASPAQYPAGPGVSPAQYPAGPGLSPAQRPAMLPGPSSVPSSPRRSLASLPDLRPIGAGAIPLMTGQLDQFLRMVSRSAVSQPNGSWRLPTDASSLLTRAAAPTQLVPGKPIQPKPAQGKPAQAKPAAQAKAGSQGKLQPKPGPQHKPTTSKQMPQKALNQKYRLNGTQGIQNLVTNEITITKIPNASRSASASPGGRPPTSPLPAEPSRSPGPAGPASRVTADGSVTIEKIRAVPPPPPSQSSRPPNSPKLLAIAESLAMRKIQSQQQRQTASRTPPSPAAASTTAGGGGAPSALSSLISLSQTQQFHKQHVQQGQGPDGPQTARGRPAASSAARCQIPNPALLHHQSQGRLTVLNVPSAETAGSGSGTTTSPGTTSASLARMERLTNSLGR